MRYDPNETIAPLPGWMVRGVWAFLLASGLFCLAWAAGAIGPRVADYGPALTAVLLGLGTLQLYLGWRLSRGFSIAPAVLSPPSPGYGAAVAIVLLLGGLMLLRAPGWWFGAAGLWVMVEAWRWLRVARRMRRATRLPGGA